LCQQHKCGSEGALPPGGKQHGDMMSNWRTPTNMNNRNVLEHECGWTPPPLPPRSSSVSYVFIGWCAAKIALILILSVPICQCFYVCKLPLQIYVFAPHSILSLICSSLIGPYCGRVSRPLIVSSHRRQGHSYCCPTQCVRASFVMATWLCVCLSR